MTITASDLCVRHMDMVKILLGFQLIIHMNCSKSELLHVVLPRHATQPDCEVTSHPGTEERILPTQLFLVTVCTHCEEHEVVERCFGETPGETLRKNL